MIWGEHNLIVDFLGFICKHAKTKFHYVDGGAERSVAPAQKQESGPPLAPAEILPKCNIECRFSEYSLILTKQPWHSTTSETYKQLPEKFESCFGI